jgi:DNA primase
MSAQDWSRVVRKKRGKGSSDTDSIPVAVIVAFYGGEVKEGRSASVRCCMHNDSRRSAVINTYDNLYFCHTCGKGGTSINVVMEKENLEFKDAVKRAGEIVVGSGVGVQQLSRRSNRKISRRTWNI